MVSQTHDCQIYWNCLLLTAQGYVYSILLVNKYLANFTFFERFDGVKEPISYANWNIFSTFVCSRCSVINFIFIQIFFHYLFPVSNYSNNNIILRLLHVQHVLSSYTSIYSYTSSPEGYTSCDLPIE